MVLPQTLHDEKRDCIKAAATETFGRRRHASKDTPVATTYNRRRRRQSAGGFLCLSLGR